MTFPKFPAFVLAAGLAVLASCASNAPKKDPYAEASAAKRAEIDRLSRRIDSLRLLPETPSLAQQIDSLRVRRSFEVGNLQSIGKAAEIQGSMRDTTQKILLLGDIKQQIIDDNRKYPISGH